MQLVVSLLILFSSIHSIGCELNKKHDYVVLSAPVSVLLKKLSLIEQVRIISSFHPSKEKVKTVSGGIFLRVDKLNLTKKSVLFFDESRDFERYLQKSEGKKVKIQTRSISAIAATRYLLKKVSPFLKNCKPEYTHLLNELVSLEKKIVRMKFSRPYLFYMDEFGSNLKNKSLLIANDGFVLDLKRNKSFRTYPSELSYVNWSAKIMSKIKNTLEIGLKTSTSKIGLKKLSESIYNIKYPGVLIPGYQQVAFLNYFLKEKLNF